MKRNGWAGVDGALRFSRLHPQHGSELGLAVFQDEEAFLDLGYDHDAALEKRVGAEGTLEHGRVGAERERVEVADLAG